MPGGTGEKIWTRYKLYREGRRKKLYRETKRSTTIIWME
jgi:hypothetical protein